MVLIVGLFSWPIFQSTQHPSHSSMSLINKLALVTGSTSGIGLSMAKSLASQGADIIIHGLGSPDAIKATCDEIAREHKVTVTFADGNLANHTNIENMMATIGKQFGGVDILVNNAGIQHVAPTAEFPVDKWDQIIAINLSAVFHTTRLALPHMKSKNWGRIINVASVHGLVGSAKKAPYVATKHGVIGFTKATALEYAQTGITINAICPGWVLTALVEAQIHAKAKEENLTFEVAKRALLMEKQPSGEFVTTDQLGAMAQFLCSNAASEIRGVCQHVTSNIYCANVCFLISDFIHHGRWMDCTVEYLSILPQHLLFMA
jgi:3-hydroxybutyrate dehydrogenase